jgi:hypothetical protein
MGYITDMDIMRIILKEFKTYGKTRYAISKETGISEPVLCRIAKGKPCEISTANTLLKYFGYQLTKGKK